MTLTETFWTNPQYRVTVVDADEDDDDNTGTLIIALLQKERRSRSGQGCDFLTIGYAIYRVGYAASRYSLTTALSAETVTQGWV